MNTKTDKKNVSKAIDSFLSNGNLTTTEQQEMDCTSGTCIIKMDKSIVERVNNKIIVEDGRHLLI